MNTFYDHHGLLLGFLAQFQFSLKSLALATGLGWVWSAAVAYVQPKARWRPLNGILAGLFEQQTIM